MKQGPLFLVLSSHSFLNLVPNWQPQHWFGKIPFLQVPLLFGNTPEWFSIHSKVILMFPIKRDLLLESRASTDCMWSLWLWRCSPSYVFAHCSFFLCANWYKCFFLRHRIIFSPKVNELCWVMHYSVKTSFCYFLGLRLVWIPAYDLWLLANFISCLLFDLLL